MRKGVDAGWLGGRAGRTGSKKRMQQEQSRKIRKHQSRSQSLAAPQKELPDLLLNLGLAGVQLLRPLLRGLCLRQQLSLPPLQRLTVPRELQQPSRRRRLACGGRGEVGLRLGVELLGCRLLPEGSSRQEGSGVSTTTARVEREGTPHSTGASGVTSRKGTRTTGQRAA